MNEFQDDQTIHAHAKVFRRRKIEELSIKIKRGEQLMDIEKGIVFSWAKHYGRQN